MGDEGKLYVPQELVSVHREKVVPVASMLTPNQFEAELLTGLRITSEQDGLAACNILHAAGPPKVVITSMQIADKLLLIGSHQKKKVQFNFLCYVAFFKTFWCIIDRYLYRTSKLVLYLRSGFYVDQRKLKIILLHKVDCIQLT
ncbi:pyridoxal kinase-like [Ananas comosus]|uniref:pyridoxal kinase n=1 Tax=Ananas comosus TaxID=4615 RepID=A0A6P5H2R5_ANACO|nr:pyridoxal kinase-like [Ananas comosus]